MNQLKLAEPKCRQLHLRKGEAKGQLLCCWPLLLNHCASEESSIQGTSKSTPLPREIALSGNYWASGHKANVNCVQGRGEHIILTIMT